MVKITKKLNRLLLIFECGMRTVYKFFLNNKYGKKLVFSNDKTYEDTDSLCNMPDRCKEEYRKMCSEYIFYLNNTLTKNNRI